MPAPVGSTIDATALSPTRRQRVSIMSGITSGVRRISAAFMGSRAPAASNADPVPGPTAVEARPTATSANAGSTILVAQGRPTTAGADGGWRGDRLPASPAGRTRVSADGTANTKVVGIGATNFVEGLEIAHSPSRQGQGSSWALVGEVPSARPSSGGPRVVSMMAPSSNMTRGGAGVTGGRSEGRRKSSLHYRVGATGSGAPTR
jgi:hypothetical protein